MSTALPVVKPEYADIVEAGELDERPIMEVAAEGGLTTNNASVRLRSARRTKTPARGCMRSVLGKRLP